MNRQDLRTVGGGAPGLLSTAVWFSFEFLCRYWATGLVLLMSVGWFVFGGLVGSAVFVHFMSAILIAPGATLVNLLGLHLFPGRSWKGDARRPLLAGLLAVALSWGVILLSLIHMDDHGGCTFGNLPAILLRTFSILVVCSSIAVAAGWALPPRPRRLGRGMPP